MQTLSSEFVQRYKLHVVVVGCGGTGGFVAEGLCRLLPAGIPLVLIDPDRVEERNLRRQNFFREELDTLKAKLWPKDCPGNSTGRSLTVPCRSVSLPSLNSAY